MNGSAPIIPECNATAQPLLIATHNTHKTREIQQILGGIFCVTDLTSHPEMPVATESGATFDENARIKATEASRRFSGLVLADDSGLEVDALNGAPGVRSARYAGEDADDERNRERLRAELLRINADGRKQTARFRCVMALARSGKVIATFEGSVEGAIINQPKGERGFGYDSLFVPEDYTETFAQLSAEVKNRISHRARALEQARDFLRFLTRFNAR
jgi:XTP/dITP diphosphohydrolase